MATANRWAIGEMYEGGLLNGQPFFTQPGGPGTQVFPTQKNAVPFVEYPVVGVIFNEYNPIWAPSCGHAISFFKVIREYDYVTEQSCALITCSVCSYVQRVIEPFEEWLNPIQNAIIIA